MSKVFTINGIDIHPGENKEVSLNNYDLPTTSLGIPIHIFRSKHPGPTILLSAGMHGEETNGIEIVRKIISRPEVQNLQCGSIIAIPVINVISFLFNSRDLPDGRDLNRCFPGHKNGSLGSRVAFDIMKQIIPLIDFGLDFHTGGAKINNYPQLRCVFDFPDNLQLAEIFSPPLIIDAVYREGTFRFESSKKGKPILVYEGGESLRFDYLAINEGVNGCLRVLNHYKMIETDVPDNPSVKITKNTWVRASESGLFHLAKMNGAYVDKGDLLGMICSPYGNIEHSVISTVSGYIVGTNNQPVVNEGDALIHLGSE